MPEEHAKKLSEAARELRKRTINNMVTLLTTAFGLVAALAWNTAIQAAFAKFFGAQSSLPAMFGYALIVTVIAVVVITYLSKLAIKEPPKV